jgi:hypothetical protein
MIDPRSPRPAPRPLVRPGDGSDRAPAIARSRHGSPSPRRKAPPGEPARRASGSAASLGGFPGDRDRARPTCRARELRGRELEDRCQDERHRDGGTEHPQHVLEAEAQGLGSRAWDVVEPVVEFDLAFVRLDRRTHLFAPPAVAGRRGLPSAAGAAETVRRDPVHRTGDDVVVTSDRSEPAPGHDPGRGARSVSVCPGPGPHRLRSLPGRASDRVGGPGSSRRSAVRDVSRRPWRGTVSRR